MKMRLLLLAIVCIGLTDFVGLYGQATPLGPEQKKKPIYIGPVFGYNRSIHTFEIPSFADDALCPTFENGNDNGFYAGLTMEYILGEVLDATNSIIARITYNTLPTYTEEYTEEGGGLPSIITDPNTGEKTEVLSQSIHTADVSFNSIQVDVMYKFNFFGSGLGIAVGPNFGFAMAKTYEQQLSLTDPPEAQFERADDWQQRGFEYINDDRTIVIEDGDIPNSNAFRLGIKAGIQYEYLMGQLYVVPHAYYNFGVTQLSEDNDWRVDALQIGVDVRYALN
ncbi:MAG: hypothetical protein ACOC2K_02105, partial [Bacteroidota bacterium]